MATQMDQQIAEVLKKMSVESGISVQDLTSEYKALTQELGNPIGALAKLKSTHKFQLGGKTGTFTGRIVCVGKTKQGRGYLDVWTQSAPGVYEQKPRRIWDTDEHAHTPGMKQNQVIQWQGKLMPKGDNALVLSGNLTPVTSPFPTIPELVEKVGSAKLDEMDKHLKQNVFIKGIVGKIFQSAFGGGIEICNPLDLESVPITIYADVNNNTIVEGTEIIVYGYVGQKQTGETVINANAIF